MECSDLTVHFLYRDSHIWPDRLLPDTEELTADQPHFHSVRQLFCRLHAAGNNCLPHDWLVLEYSLGLCIRRIFW